MHWSTATLPALSALWYPSYVDLCYDHRVRGQYSGALRLSAETLVNSLGEYLAANNKQQLRIAETEKYAHVTFFFSGGRESLYQGEERLLIPSPDVSTYDQMPEMSAPEVTEKLVEAIGSGKFDAIICNYANCDQVGHTGDLSASIKAVEAVDACLAKVLEAADPGGGELLITADHGNVEEMFDEFNNQPHTQHTTLPVPLVYAGHRQLSLDSDGSLADIAPTMLALMGLQQPVEMTGRSQSPSWRPELRLTKRRITLAP